VAREQQNREDLLGEATALVERIELSVAGMPESIVIGFRKNGSGCIYFGPDPVFQFNAAGQLRRAFVDGKKYAANKGRLVTLERDRAARSLQLQRSELSDSATDDFLATMQQKIALLQIEIAHDRYTVVGQVPKDADLTGRVRQWISILTSEPLEIASTPNA